MFQNSGESVLEWISPLVRLPHAIVVKQGWKPRLSVDVNCTRPSGINFRIFLMKKESRLSSIWDVERWRNVENWWCYVWWTGEAWLERGWILQCCAVKCVCLDAGSSPGVSFEYIKTHGRYQGWITTGKYWNEPKSESSVADPRFLDLDLETRVPSSPRPFETR
jgi:hypothetical protein